MTDGHILEDTFRRFLSRQATRAESQQVVRHLLTECLQCQETIAQLTLEGGYWLPRPDHTDSDYETVIRSSFDSADERAGNMAVAHLRGWGQWAALESLSPGERLDRVIANKEYHHWGLYRALLDASRWFGLRKPEVAVEVMELALTVIEVLDEEAVGGTAAAMDMRARGQALLGNARRLASDLDGARAALDAAWRLNALGTGDPLEKAQLISFDASWSRNVGELEVAEASLEEALRIYRSAGDRHMQGRTLLQMGNAIGYVDPERGLSHVRAGLALIDGVREPRLELTGQSNLAYLLAEAGRPEEALSVLDASLDLFRQFQDDYTQARLHHLQARIARSLGQLGEAVSIYRHLWDDFKAREQRFDLVMVSIDLAEALIALSEYGAAAQLIAEVYPMLASWQLPRHATAAWLMFKEAVEGEQRADVFTSIRQFYRRHWVTPAEFSS
jgi:tetratricopeptide (TPR) repeat protein